MCACVVRGLLPIFLAFVLSACGGADNPSDGACSDLSMLGTWQGTVSAPSTLDYGVSLEFRADCRYSAYSIDLPGASYNTPAFFYGSNDDSPQKLFSITNIFADGSASGDINIVFADGTSRVGTLLNITVLDNTLSFEFYNSWESTEYWYGPIVFTLKKTS